MSTIFPGTRASAHHRRFDVIVIGAGPAGVLAAVTARREGARVAIIEEMRGNSCDLVGHAPFVHAVGGTTRAPGPLEKLVGVQRYAGTAEFVSPSALRTGVSVVEAEAFVVATGSVARRPDVAGLGPEHACTPEDLADQELPRRIAVLGAGPTGLEVAQAYARRGSNVTLLDTCSAILPHSPVCGQFLARALRRELDLHLGVRISGAAVSPHGILLRWASGGDISQAPVDRVVFALGRMPRVRHLALERAAVEQFAGVAIVDRYRRTSNPRVFVAGDDAPDPDGLLDNDKASEVAGYNAARPHRSKTVDVRPCVRIVATDPPYACVGEPEPSARARLGELYTAARRYAMVGVRPRALGGRRLATADDGLVRMWTDRSGRILGGEAIGEGADLLVHLLAHAIANGSTADSLRSVDFSPRSVARSLFALADAIVDAIAASTATTASTIAQASVERASAVPPVSD